MITLKKVAYLALAITLIVGFSASVQAKEWKGWNNHVAGYPNTVAMDKFAELLKEKSGGKIRLDIFPNEQLGSEREMIEQVQIGCIDMTKTSTAPLESFIPIMGVFSVPYVFRDSEQYWKCRNSCDGIGCEEDP